MRCYNCTNSNRRYNQDLECVYMPQCLMQDVERKLKYEEFKLAKNSYIKFKDDRYWWKIVDRNDRFLICTRETKNNFYYTICDLQDCIRGSDNFNPSNDYEDIEEVKNILTELNNGDITISYRNYVPLDIIKERLCS